MSFIQILDFHTTKFDEVRTVESEWERATEGRRTTRRQIVTRDRNDPNHYMIIVFFDSHESAMLNSALPETEEIAAKMAALADGQPSFHDLDVVDDRT